MKSYEIETLQLETLKNKYIMLLEFRSFPEFQSILCLVKIEINQSLLKIKVDNYLRTLRRSLPISKQDIKFANVIKVGQTFSMPNHGYQIKQFAFN